MRQSAKLLLCLNASAALLPWQQLQALRAAGWSIYDPTNPNTRTLRASGADNYVSALADGAGVLTTAAQATEANQFKLLPAVVGELDGLESLDGTVKTMVTPAFSALAQPNCIIELVKPATATPGADRYSVDGIGASNRHAVGISAANNHRMFAGSDIGFGAVRDNEWQIWESYFNTPTTASLSSFSRNGMYLAGSNNTGAATLTGLTFGQRYAANGSHWRGEMSVKLFHPGPTLDQRIQAVNLLMELAAITETLSISAPRGYLMDADGTEIWAKDEDTIVEIYSITKVIAALVVNRWVSNYSDTYTVVAGDLVGGSTASLMTGDVVTITDLLYGAALPSGNDAATALQRYTGQLILDAESGGVGDPMTRFASEMQDVVDDLGLTDITVGTGAWTGAFASARDTAWLFKALTEISLMATIFGATSHTMTITGANARTYSVTSTLAGLLWEGMYVAGKTGSGGGLTSGVMKASRVGRSLIAVALDATNTSLRDVSLRNQLDSVRE